MPLLSQLISHAFVVVFDNNTCAHVVLTLSLLLGNLEHHMKIIFLWFIVHKIINDKVFNSCSFANYELKVLKNL